MRSPMIMVVYALLLLGAGAVAYLAAPEGANAATALLVPGACALVMIVCAAVVTATRRTNLRAARRAHLVALICSLAFGAAFASRGGQASLASNRYRDAEYRYQAAVKEGKAQDTPEARKKYFADAGAPDHDKKYLANTLWALMFISAAAFLALLVSRPGGGAELINKAVEPPGDGQGPEEAGDLQREDADESTSHEQREFR